ncbi:hypothetical protein HD554DRAFT_2090860 [Boletus coccyginus]|nr:hypothetical protein HD554DRAFT_2090860 [Boletus coccyginus]
MARRLSDTAALEYMVNPFAARYDRKPSTWVVYAPIHLSVNDVPRCRCTQLDHQHDQPVLELASGATGCMDSVRRSSSSSPVDTFDSPEFPTPDIDPMMHLCNSIPANKRSLLDSYAFSDFPFLTLRLPTSRALASEP